jgi:membrane-bound lytic murein transglycosylase D
MFAVITLLGNILTVFTGRKLAKNLNWSIAFAISLSLCSIALILAITALSANAQSSQQVEDPVVRAIKQIDSVTSQQVTLANQEIIFTKEAKTTKVTKEESTTNVTSTVDKEFKPFEVLSNPRYKTALVRFRQYGEPIARILTEENMPQELMAVALVESGFNPLALSPKGARGIWQFIPATARRYGLSVDSSFDHRIDPEHSTRAAARYLRDLYERFGDWRLALAAYNAGENRIQNIIDKTGTYNFEHVANYLPKETRTYVPTVLSIWAQLGKLESLTLKPINQANQSKVTSSQIVIAPFKLGLPN